MSYRILAPSLHATADAARTFLHQQWGVGKKAIKIEESISPDFSYRPTLSAETKDCQLMCVEVSESAYSNTIDTFVRDCVNRNLPVRLYIALPKDIEDQYYSSKIKKAKENGVGILEVNGTEGILIQEAISLSLAKVRPIDKQQFPLSYREALASAEHTFRSASPDKGCAILYDEIEDLCRRIAVKLNDKKLWQSKQKIQFDYDRGNWASLVELIQRNIDLKRSRCPELKAAFIARIHGITPYRNESGHKPRTQAQRMHRDKQLRTRFELATDILYDLIKNTKKLKP